MRVAVLVLCILLSTTWAEKEIGELLDTARDRLRCVSDPKCIDTLGIQRLLHVTNLKFAAVKDVTMILAHHLLHGDSSCTVQLSSLDIVEDEVMRAIGTEDVSGIMRIFKRILKDGGKKKCTGVDDILRDMILPPTSYSPMEWVRSVLSVLMEYVMKGYCLEELAQGGDSLDNLFNHYGDECSPYLSAKGLEKMMNDLEITGNNHDHHHHHDHQHHEHDNHNHESGQHQDHNHHNHDHECDHQHESVNNDHNHDHSDINHKHFDPSHADHEHFEKDQNKQNHSFEDDHRRTIDYFPPHNHTSKVDHNHHNHSDSHNHTLEIEHSYHEHSDPHNHTSEEYHSHNDHSDPHNHTSEEYHSHHDHGKENISHSEHDQDKDDKLIYIHGNHSDNHISSTQYSSKPDLDTHKNGTLNIEVKLIERMESLENSSEKLENIFSSKLSDLWHPTTLASEESNVVSKILPPPSTVSRHIPAEECLSAESLVSRYGSDRVTISKSEFLSLCPVIVNQRVGAACEEPFIAVNLPSKSEIYGYGSISVAVLCLASLSGVLLIPLMKQTARYYIIAAFQGLAFSTLASDALLHLLPEVLDLHSHNHSDGHSHSHEENSFPEPYAQLLLGVFVTIYLIFLMEAILCAISGRSKESSGHGHSHGSPLAITDPILTSVKSQSTTHLQMSPQSSLNTEIIDMDTVKKPPNLMVNEPVFCGLTSLALVITLGDALHNFGDGLAIGAAFSANIRGGLSTAAAGLCHELPHELGDFVVLLSSGLSYSKALVINFMSSLTCFAGLYVGILIGDNMVARKWVMAATASTFLYIALAEMIPELREHRHGSPVKMLFAKNIGIILGLAIMCLISVYEHQMA